MAKAYGFQREGVKRIVSVVRQVEGEPVDLTRGRGEWGGGEFAEKMVITSVGGDVLQCQRWHEKDAKGFGPVVFVAKPWDLRLTPFHGKSVNGFTYSYTGASDRTSTKDSDSTTEDQVIVPAYFNGAIIHAMPCVVERIGEADVVYIDLNVAGRAWAMDE